MAGLERRRLLAALGVAVVLAGACSGDDDASTSATTRAPASASPSASGSDSTTTSSPTGADSSGGAASPGCEAAPAVAPGEQDVTITSAGASRWYVRHVPPGHGAAPLPLVVDLHGYTEGARIHVQMSSLGVFGDTNGFVTVTPQGQGDIARWDAFLDSADVTFFGDLLDDVERTLCIDRTRVFVTGYSNGGLMTSVVACAYADRVAAAAPIAGVADIPGCAPSRPVPVVVFHGTADQVLSFDGGLGPAAAALPAPDGSGRTLGELGVGQGDQPSVPEITASWAARNGCDSTPAEEAVAADVVVERYPCPAGADAELYRIEDGGHTWPGSALAAALPHLLGKTTMSISANDVMWRFFEAHPLPAAAGS
jgi:polyhydroxybutyrate depolymerase